MLDCCLPWLEPEEFTAWRARLRAETVARNLTPARRDCLIELLRMLALGETPTDAKIASATGHGERTVRRAREDARRLGLLSWQPTRGLVHGRWRRGRNAYAMHTPATPVCPAGQAGRASKTDKKEDSGGRSAKVQLAMLGTVQGPENARLALARIAGQRAQTVAAWAGRRA